jgi:hypothetical protein
MVSARRDRDASGIVEEKTVAWLHLAERVLRRSGMAPTGSGRDRNVSLDFEMSVCFGLGHVSELLEGVAPPKTSANCGDFSDEMFAWG